VLGWCALALGGALAFAGVMHRHTLEGFAREGTAARATVWEKKQVDDGEGDGGTDELAWVRFVLEDGRTANALLDDYLHHAQWEALEVGSEVDIVWRGPVSTWDGDAVLVESAVPAASLAGPLRIDRVCFGVAAVFGLLAIAAWQAHEWIP
jgi:hypothetical protein